MSSRVRQAQFATVHSKHVAAPLYYLARHVRSLRVLHKVADVHCEKRSSHCRNLKNRLGWRGNFSKRVKGGSKGDSSPEARTKPKRNAWVVLKKSNPETLSMPRTQSISGSSRTKVDLCHCCRCLRRHIVTHTAGLYQVTFVTAFPRSE